MAVLYMHAGSITLMVYVHGAESYRSVRVTTNSGTVISDTDTGRERGRGNSTLPIIG